MVNRSLPVWLCSVISILCPVTSFHPFSFFSFCAKSGLTIISFRLSLLALNPRPCLSLMPNMSRQLAPAMYRSLALNISSPVSGSTMLLPPPFENKGAVTAVQSSISGILLSSVTMAFRFSPFIRLTLTVARRSYE